MNWGPRGRWSWYNADTIMVGIRKAGCILLYNEISLTPKRSGFFQTKGKVGEGQISQGQALGCVLASETHQDICATVALFHSTPKYPSATACISTELRKSEIWNDFPSHWNKGQTPRVNSEATRMGKVECWSETENPKVKQWSSGNFGKQSSQDQGRYSQTSSDSQRCLGEWFWILAKGECVCSFLSRNLSFLLLSYLLPHSVNTGAWTTRLHPLSPFFFFTWWVSY